jgi:hypothetical protein
MPSRGIADWYPTLAVPVLSSSLALRPRPVDALNPASGNHSPYKECPVTNRPMSVVGLYLLFFHLVLYRRGQPLLWDPLLVDTRAAHRWTWLRTTFGLPYGSFIAESTDAR